jgi:predicted regulator of Ras-like GTPase activity (Roadblock/LC7/MglB family)
MAIDAAKLAAILQDFVSSTGDVQGAALVTPDGLSLASVLPSGMDEERVAAMSAAMLSLGERIGNELVRGTIQQIYVEGDKGYGVLTGCGDDSVFLVLANHTAKQGLLMLEIRRAVGQLKPVLT